MKKKILLSPLVIIVLIVILGVGAAGAAVLLGGGGNTENVSLQKGLIGWWKMDGNAKDATPRGNNGTVTGAIFTTDRKGQANKAYSFNGTSDYISVGDPNIRNNDFTISGWAYRTGSDMVVYAQSVSTNDKDYIVIRQNDFSLRSDATPTQDVSVVVAFPLNQWSHVAIVWVESTKTVTAYQAGVSVGSSQNLSFTSVIAPTHILIGDYLDNTGATHHYAGGSIDDVRIYNRALSSAEITALYESYDPGIVVSDLQKGLVGQWKLDANAKDATPNSNNGTLTGTTQTTDRKGTANKAYSFDGSTSDISMGDPANGSLETSSAMSISAWIKTGTLSSGSRTIAAKWDGTNGFRFIYYNNDFLNLFVGAQNGQIAINLEDNIWHHVVGTWDGTSTRIYVDGVLPADGTDAPGTSLAANTGSFRIGFRDGGVATDYWKGDIDDVRYYNRVLSQTEITALYQSYNPGIVVSDLQKGLVGQWKFDANAKDSTPNSNNGTVTGTTQTTDRKGQSNKAYSFNGTSDFISLGRPAALQSLSNFTVSAWIYPAADGYIVNQWAPAFVNEGEFIFRVEGSKIDAFIDELSGVITGAGTITVNTWQHVAVTVVSNTRMDVYINGVNVGSDTTIGTTSPYLHSATNLLIGSHNTGGYFSGSIDDVRIYNRTLSAAEVLALYESY